MIEAVNLLLGVVCPLRVQRGSWLAEGAKGAGKTMGDCFGAKIQESSYEKKILCVLAALAAGLSLCQATIVIDGLNSDGALRTTGYGLEQTGGGGTLNINADHNFFGPGRIFGSITSDSEQDPTVWLVASVNNDTGFTWTDYHVQLTMNQPFSIVGVISPADWTWAVTPPTLIGSDYVGLVDYYAGTPILPGQTGQFGLVISFSGSVNFSTTWTPTGVVPEPSTYLAGALLLVPFGAGLMRRSLKH